MNITWALQECVVLQGDLQSEVFAAKGGNLGDRFILFKTLDVPTWTLYDKDAKVFWWLAADSLTSAKMAAEAKITAILPSSVERIFKGIAKFLLGAPKS